MSLSFWRESGANDKKYNLPPYIATLTSIDVTVLLAHQSLGGCDCMIRILRREGCAEEVYEGIIIVCLGSVSLLGEGISLRFDFFQLLPNRWSKIADVVCF